MVDQVGAATPAPARVTASALPPAPPTFQSLQVWYQARSERWVTLAVVACVAQCANARSGSPCH